MVLAHGVLARTGAQAGVQTATENLTNLESLANLANLANLESLAASTVVGDTTTMAANVQAMVVRRIQSLKPLRHGPAIQA